MKQILIVLSVMLTLIGCTDEASFVDSEQYHAEELRAYDDVFNEIADTTFYYKKLRERGAEQAVFFLYRDLSAVDNSRNADEPFEEFVTVQLKKRQHGIERLKNFPKYRFASAEEKKLPETIYLNLQEGEESMFEWITISRVLFNSNFTQGLLYYRKWSGDLASGGGTLRIRKVEGKWVVTEKILALVA